MIVVNKLTAPGGIKRIDIYRDSIRVVTTDGRDIGYDLVRVTDSKKEERKR